MSTTPIKTAVFPVAGSGSGFQAATKSQPKEMLSVLDKPLIQYAVEEAAQAGCTRFVFIERPDQKLLERYFDAKAAIARVKPGLEPEILAVVQEQPLGLGHAILTAREEIGENAPFAVLLPDDLIDADPPALAQMARVYPRLGGALLAGIEVTRKQLARYGVMSIVDTGGDVVRVLALEEKPDSDATISNFSITGRYILPPEIFDALERTAPDGRGALQLTDAIARLIGGTPVHGQRYQGERFDCGDVSGYVRATIAMAARRPELRDDVVTYIRRTLDRIERETRRD